MGSPHPRRDVAGGCQQSGQGGYLLFLVLVQISSFHGLPSPFIEVKL